jgi:hypothetical protein|tara:strand:- start:549 stop:1067 length:519 start_codon:yes stop_codon:yes gene_type:complete
MDEKHKYKVYILTFILDIFLILLLIYKNLHLLDKFWIYSVLFCHVIFYYAVKKDKIQLIDILHYLIAIFILFSLFLKSIFIKAISLFLIVVIQYLWIYEKICILNKVGENFGFSDILHYLVILFTVILSINIGFSYSKNSPIENINNISNNIENTVENIIKTTEKTALKKQH